MGADGQELSSDNIYWALKSGKDLASALEDKERAYFESARARGLLTLWIVEYAAYYGMDPESLNVMASKQLGFDGDEQEFIRFHINEVRTIIRQQIIMALGERPAFQGLTENSDHRSQVSAEIADHVIRSMYRRYCEDGEWEVAEGDGVFGAGASHMQWDPQGGDQVSVDQPVTGPDGQPSTAKTKRKSGAPRVTTVFEWANVKEPRFLGPEADWRIIRERDNRWNIAAKYPEQREQILAQKTDDQYDFAALFNLDWDVSSNDACIIKHFYHPDCAAIPGGRYTIVFGSLVLWDGPCPTSEGVPVAEMCSSKFIETNFPFADSSELLAVQQALNQLNSDEFSNFATFGRQSVAMEKGTEITVDAIATGGKAFFYPSGAKPPSAVLMTAAPPTIGVAKDYLHKRLDSISMVNGVARGDPSYPNVRSGEMAALFHSIAIEYQSFRQRSLDRYRIRLANMMLDFVRRYSETQFLVELVGIEDRPYMDEFTAEDLSGVKRVYIETVSPYQKTTAGKIEMAKLLLEAPPEERAALYEMATVGNSSTFLRKDRSCELRIRRENEDLLTGSRAVMVTNGDHPQKHMRGHYADLERLLASDNPDMEAVKRFQDHITEHLQGYYGMDPTFCQIFEIPPPPPIPPDPATGRPPNPAFMFAVWQSQVPGGGVPPSPQPGQAPGGPPGPQQSQSAGGPPGGSSDQQQPGAPPAAQRAAQGGVARDSSGVRLPQPSAPPGA